MLAYLVRRTFGAVVVLFAVVTITFFLIRIAPGGPFDDEKEPPEHVRKAQLEKYGMQGSLAAQYGRYLGSVITGDLRYSTQYKERNVNEMLADTLPFSFVLGGLALLIASLTGILLGTVAAVRKHSWIDRSAMFFALVSISLPTFVTGPLLILVFGLWLGWFPVGGWFEVKSVVLPALCLAGPFTAYIARLMRNSMLEVLRQEFVRTAVAKGLPGSKVVMKHAMKVAILPIVSYLGPLAAQVLTGSIAVELVFGIAGAGRFFVDSIQNRDGFLLGGVVVVYCALLVSFNLLVDVAYSRLDRRIRLYD
jgi:oligopeptide transport system permease protein